MERAAAEARLVAEGLLRDDGGVLRTTPRWQAGVMRAARRLVEAGVTGGDERVPYTLALLEALPGATDAELAGMVVVLAGIEAAEAGTLPAGKPLAPGAP